MFQTNITVRIGEVNYGGHLGNDSLLTILQEARLQMLQQYGLSELSAGGHGMIMADVMIAYQGEAFHGDVLTVSIYATQISSLSFDLLYEVVTLRGNQRQKIAAAKTGMVCFDYNLRKVCEMSSQLQDVLAGNVSSNGSNGLD